MTPEQAIFPGGYRVIDIVVAGCFASARHTGRIHESQTAQAAFEQHLKALAGRHADVPLPVLMDNAYTITLHDFRLERFEFLGEPLRAAWFELAYESWALVAWRAGLISAPQIQPDAALARVRTVLAELGVEASAGDCMAEIDRFVPVAAGTNREPGRDVSFAASAFVKAMRYGHFAALRHRRRVGPGFVEAGVLIAGADPPGAVEHDVTSYLHAHRIFAGTDPASAQTGDRLLAILSDEAFVARGFWRTVEAGLGLGLRPLVLTLLPREAIDALRARVPAAHAAAFASLSESTVVEMTRDVTRFVPLLRALDSVAARRWWWRDDAIDIATALDVFHLFDRTGPAPRGSSPTSAKPYPLPQAAADIARGLDLGATFATTSLDAWTASYDAEANALVPLRGDFPDGHFRLPCFVVACWTRVLLGARAMRVALHETIQAHAQSQMQLCLFSLGIGTSPGDVDRMLGAIADLPWAAPAAPDVRVTQHARAFIALVGHLGDAAVARNQRVGLKFPLRSSFLSYARADEALARRLVTYVEAKNVADIWWDMNSITMGSVLDQTLRGAVEGAECVLLLVSPSSITSRYVRIELDCAIGAGLPVVPILTGTEPEDGVAAAFGRPDAAAMFQTALRIDPGDEEGSFRMVAAVLARDAGATVQWLNVLQEN
jgi:hypothetical protein